MPEPIWATPEQVKFGSKPAIAANDEEWENVRPCSARGAHQPSADGTVTHSGPLDATGVEFVILRGEGAVRKA